MNPQHKISLLICVVPALLMVVTANNGTHGTNETGPINHTRTLADVGRCYEKRAALCKQNCTQEKPANLTKAQESCCENITKHHNVKFVKCLAAGRIYGNHSCFSLNVTIARHGNHSNWSSSYSSSSSSESEEQRNSKNVTEQSASGKRSGISALAAYAECVMICVADGDDCTEGCPSAPRNVTKVFNRCVKKSPGKKMAHEYLKCFNNSDD